MASVMSQSLRPGGSCLCGSHPHNPERKSDPNRREFLQASAALGVAMTTLAGTEAHAATVTNAEGIPMRPLGRTGEMVTLICLGGYHSSVHRDENDSIRLIQRAVDEGITFLDNAWDYHDGGAEERMGKRSRRGTVARRFSS